MANLRLTADSSQLVSEVKKAKEALKTAKSEYKAASAEAELYGTKEAQLVNKIKSANQVQTTRTTALQTYQKAIHQLQTEINNWEKEEQELIQKLKEAQQANDTTKIKEYEAALAKLRTQIKNNQTELNSVTRSYNDVRTEMANTERQTRELQEELNDLSNTIEQVETTTSDTGENLDDMADGAGNAGMAVFSLQDALSTASSMLKDFGDLIDGITNKFEQLVVDGIEATATALVELGKYSLTTGIGFEASMSNLMATMGKTKEADEYGILKETAEYYGRTTKYSATDAANALNILAQSGLDANEQISTIDDVLNLAAAGALNMDIAAKYVTGSVKGFGDEMKNASKYADLIAKGASLANTNTDMLGVAFSTAAANANSYSQTADSLTLALLRLAEQNVVGTDASTALNRVMMDLYTPTSKAAEVLDQLGVKAYDDTHKAKDLNIVIDELNKALQGYDEESQNIIKNSIFSTFGLNAFNKMVVTSTEDVEKFKNALAGADGAAAEMAATMANNMKGSLDNFESAVEGFGIRIYDNIIPGLRKALDHATAYISELTAEFGSNGLGEAMEKISTAFQNFATKIPQLLSAHTPTIIKIFNSIIDVLVVVIDYLPVLIDTVLPQLLSIIESIAAKLPGFLERVMPVLVDGIGWLITNFPILIAGLYGLQGLTGVGAGLLDIGGIVAGIAVAAQAAGTSLAAIASAAAPVLGVIAAVAAAIAAVVAIVGTAWATSENFRNYCGTVLYDLKQQFAELTKTITDSVVRIMQDMGLEVQSAGDAMGVLLNLISKVATTIVFIISQIVSQVMTYLELIINAATSTIEAISSLISAFVSLVNGNLEAAAKSFNSFMGAVTGGFSNMWGILRDSCNDFGNDFGDFLKEMQKVVGNNPLEVTITSDLDVESFRQDMSLVASWGLPGLDESKFGPLFRDQYKDNSKKPNNNYIAQIESGINAANASINHWNTNSPVFNNNYVTNSPTYNWNTNEAGDENKFLKMSRETEAYGKYTSI